MKGSKELPANEESERPSRALHSRGKHTCSCDNGMVKYGRGCLLYIADQDGLVAISRAPITVYYGRSAQEMWAKWGISPTRFWPAWLGHTRAISMFAGSTNGSTNANQIPPLGMICNPSQINICLSFVPNLLSLSAFVQQLSHNLFYKSVWAYKSNPKGFDQNLLAHLLTKKSP